jgi:hypothetical protein
MLQKNLGIDNVHTQREEGRSRLDKGAPFAKTGLAHHVYGGEEAGLCHIPSMRLIRPTRLG